MAHVRCEQHGIFYNTDGPGCPVCRSAPTKQDTNRDWRAVGVGTGVTAVVVAVILSTSFMRTLAPPPPASHESASGEATTESQPGDPDLASADSAIPSHPSDTRATLAGAVADGRTERQMLTDLHAILTGTIDSARRRALHIPEPPQHRRSTEATRLQREWDSVRESVLASLEAISGRIPSSYRWSRNGDLALRSMERAATELATTLQRSSLPSRTSRESSFERATDQLERATAYLTRLAQ